MKRVRKVALILSSGLALVGCTPANFYTVQTPKPVKSTIKVVVPKDTETKWVKIDNRDNFIWDKSGKEMPRQLAETFYTAAVYGKQHGYRYFAVTQKNTNNLSGFPINDFNEMLRYCQLKGKGHFRSMCWDYDNNGQGIIVNRSVYLKVQYFKEPVPGIFLYNIEQTMKETEKYF